MQAHHNDTLQSVRWIMQPWRDIIATWFDNALKITNVTMWKFMVVNIEIASKWTFQKLTFKGLNSVLGEVLQKRVVSLLWVLLSSIVPFPNLLLRGEGSVLRIEETGAWRWACTFWHVSCHFRWSSFSFWITECSLSCNPSIFGFVIRDLRLWTLQAIATSKWENQFICNNFYLRATHIQPPFIESIPRRQGAPLCWSQMQGKPLKFMKLESLLFKFSQAFCTALKFISNFIVSMARPDSC